MNGLFTDMDDDEFTDFCEPFPGELDAETESRLVLARPVDLLRDGKGVYGIGGVDFRGETSNLILRPDHLRGMKRFTGIPVLQRITGGFRRGMFSNMQEERFRKIIHIGLLTRRGFTWPPTGDFRERYWSSDPQQQLRNRKIYHGLRLASLEIVNKLIGQALEEAADKDALAVARRFRFKERYAIYRAASLSRRALQLAATFPALALAVFNNQQFIRNDDWCAYEVDHRAENARRVEAVRLIEVGAPLNTIADLMRVPMAFRKVKPGAAGLVFLGFTSDIQRPVHTYMPDSLPRMKRWLHCVWVAQRAGPEFVGWVAKHALEIGGTFDEIRNFLIDLMDWVDACYPERRKKREAGAPEQRAPMRGGEQFVTRRFTPDMSLKTVIKLSHGWHEAVANNMSGPDCDFPEPWCPAGQSGGYEIVPITTSGDLYREGHAMHHCVGAYNGAVQAGHAYVYSVREGVERIATLSLQRYEQRATIEQLRGPCNKQVSKKVERAVVSWLKAQTSFKLPVLPKQKSDVDDCLDELDQIPF
jgi:PcfJ-like protein